MLGYIGGKQFEEQPWKGVVLGLAIAFSVAFPVEWLRHRRRQGSGTRGVRIHVTGATGFLGSELVRLAPAATGERVEVRDGRAVAELFRRLEPEVVIHTAYRQDGDGAREIVVEGSENVARAATAVGARLVHL